MNKKEQLDLIKMKLDRGDNPTDLMNEIERKFDIPMLNNEEYNRANMDVIKLYLEISKKRDELINKELFCLD